MKKQSITTNKNQSTQQSKATSGSKQQVPQKQSNASSQQNTKQNVNNKQQQQQQPQKNQNSKQKQEENNQNLKKSQLDLEKENQLKEQEIKQQQQLILQQQQEEETKQQELQKKEPVIGHSVVKYSHYKEKFQHVDGFLVWKAIEDQYCFSVVFTGNYHLKLKKEKDKKFYLETEKRSFKGLEDGEVYIVEVDEDPEALQKEKHVGYSSTANQQYNIGGNKGNNKQHDNITNELKNMSIDELKEKGDKYKQLIEARDLEDCLYK